MGGKTHPRRDFYTTLLTHCGFSFQLPGPNFPIENPAPNVGIYRGMTAVMNPTCGAPTAHRDRTSLLVERQSVWSSRQWIDTALALALALAEVENYLQVNAASTCLAWNRRNLQDGSHARKVISTVSAFSSTLVLRFCTNRIRRELPFRG